MTSLDTCVDPQAAALATLIKGAVNYEMLNDPRFKVTEDAVDTVYGHPTPLSILTALSLPALSIYRFSETIEEFTFEKDYYVVDFRFDYITAAVKRESIGARWALLRPVWRRLYDVVDAGQHAQVHDNRELLAAAGIEMIDRSATRVQYDYAPDAKGFAYPYFRGQIRLKHLEVDPAEDPQLFLSLAANYILDGFEPEEQPFIKSLTYTPTGQEAKDAEDSPLDDAYLGDEDL